MTISLIDMLLYPSVLAIINDNEHAINVSLDSMHVGDHFHDIPRNIVTIYKYMLDQSEEVLPKGVLHNFVESRHWEWQTVIQRNIYVCSFLPAIEAS